ncbi:MAG: glycosyltransferase family 4 protein [Bacteroidia bacterium]|nr:glycosyltransferase family 4 protein [Bacteroidia bacterium]
MKVAINTRFLLKNKLEGFGHFTNETLKRIVINNPQVQFYFLFDRAFDQSYIYAENVIPVVIPPPARHPILWNIWFNISVSFWLKKHQPDLFLSPDGFACLTTKTKQLSVIHDLAFEHFEDGIPKSHLKYMLKNSPKFANKVNRIATVSQFSKNDIINKYKINPAKIDVVYNGASNLFQQISKAEKDEIKEKYSAGHNYFLYVGSIHPRKNVASLLQAFDLFKSQTNSDFKLVLTGRMAWKTSAVSNIYNQMKHKNDVIFTGYLSNEELAKITASAFAMCYVSLFEGFGIPIIEAMKCGVPVICSNTSSMKEIGEGATVQINPNSIESITYAMALLFKDKVLQQTLITKGLARQSMFSWDKSAELLWQSCLKAME